MAFQATSGVDFNCQNTLDGEERGRETVTYWFQISQCNYLPIVELEKKVVFGPQLEEEL